MKIKYTQSARESDVDTDLALAIALEEDVAEICNSDDDFQATGSSPAIITQTLALRNCAKNRHMRKKVRGRNLRVEKKQGGDGGIGDVAQQVIRADRSKKLKIRCDAAAFVGSGDRVSEDGGRRCREIKETDKRILKDHNGKSSERAIIGSLIVDSVLLAKGDENGNKLKSEKVEKCPISSTPVLERNLATEITDRHGHGSYACEPSKQVGQRDNNVKFDPKGGKGTSIDDTRWSQHFDGAKEDRRTSGVPETDIVQNFERTVGIVGLDFLNFESDDGAESDQGAEIDEGLIICTQLEAPIKVNLSQSAEERSAALDMGLKTTEDPPKHKQNIYDILLGDNRKYRVPLHVTNATFDQSVEYDGVVEEMETPGTAMRALVDEAELDYNGLDFNEEENECMHSLKCPICGIDLVELSVNDREHHVSDCLENDNILCGRKKPGTYPGCEADSTEATEATDVVQVTSSPRNLMTGTLECPVCGVCIENFSTAQREEHTNACLEKGIIPCERTNPGDFLDCEATDIVQLPSTQRNLIIGTLQCPVCGVCIEELSTSQREEHTNACLDKTREEELGEVAEFSETEVAQALARIDAGPIVAWLTSLNLVKYVGIFVKEEIDMETLKWLTDEDLNSLGITALGPRRKIVGAIQELRKGASTTQQLTAMQEGQRPSNPVLSTSIDTNQGSRKSIADFFVPPLNAGQRVPASDRDTLIGIKGPGTASTAGGSVRNKDQRRPIPAGGNSRTSDIPTWMCIPGTSFRVDAFKHTAGNCSNWFLTHFHTDHYQGLTRGFRHGKIFCSSITARLVNLRIGIPPDRIQALPLNETILVDGIRVTFIDANHCPGSVMILFEPPNGKAVLHTGDFRFCSDMTNSEVLRACRITTLILDTTYCDPQYDFPKQDAVVQFVIDAIQAEAFNPKTLFLIGTYTIGKERIFLEVGKALQKYVHVGAAKQRLLDCMDLTEEDKKWLTAKDQESHIHVVPLWSVASFKRMGSISRHYHGRYNSIVAFSPTGWSFGKDKKRVQGRPGRRYQQGSIIRYEVPYSEHCSFTELKEFVRAIAPENIIPSVIGNSDQTADAMVASLLSEGRS